MIVLGYLIDKIAWEINDPDFGSLTHINYAFAKVTNPHGEVSETWVRAHQIKELKMKFPSLKVCASIGGLGATYFSEAAQTSKGRQLFSKSSIEIMVKYGMDGIDIDWEYPTIPEGGISCHPDDKKNFTLLLKQVRKDLNELSKVTKQDYLLTIAAGATMSYIENVEMKELNAVLDFMNVMTYDMGGFLNVTGHHTNVFPSTLSKNAGMSGGAYFIDEFVKAGMALNKLVFGIAFYGRGGTQVEDWNHGLGSRIKGEQGLYFNYHEIVKKLRESGYIEYWDDFAKAPWAYNGDTFITYENARSIKEKMSYVKEKSLLGVMFWQYQADTTKTLLNSINKYK
ncbi:MAG: glycoside hydrolase family 18 protein [Turicibacter sp.]